MRSTRIAAAALSALLIAWPCAAQKTDIVVLKSGDRITCEIKALQYGYLEVETDSLGTLSVVWSDVGELSSQHHFVVEDTLGRRFAGTLRSPARGKLEIPESGGPPLDTFDVVALWQDRETFLRRIDGSVQVSFNLARANNQRQWAFSGDGRYTGRSWFDVLSMSSTFTSQDGVPDTQRNSFNLQSGRHFSTHWMYAGVSTIQQDDELGLELRVGGGGGVGRTLVSSNRRSLEVLGGLVVTNERFEDVEGTQTNLEAFGLTRYEGFRRRSPKLDMIVTFVLLPNLTDPGRVRGEFGTSASVEVVHNFFVGLSAFDSFDTRPPDATLPKHDYGISPSFRWKF